MPGNFFLCFKSFVLHARRGAFHLFVLFCCCHDPRDCFQVSFPAILDMYEFCAPSLQAILKVSSNAVVAKPGAHGRVERLQYAIETRRLFHFCSL